MALPDEFAEARCEMVGGPADGAIVHCSNAENPPAEVEMPGETTAGGRPAVYRRDRRVGKDGRFVRWRYVFVPGR